ncbi:MAG TPA: hypothetical protein VFU73_01540 [Actinocrinis sp.]|nr:hypothetical protein [Actinocrinis sp.]
MAVQISSTLMQNHVAGVAPVPYKSLAVSCADDQSPILFGVDEKDRLSVTQRDPGQTTGWRQTDLTAQLAGVDGLGVSPLIQCLATVQDCDGATWIAIAASSGDPAAQSHLLLAPAVPNTVKPQDWAGFGASLLACAVPSGVAFSELVLGSGDDGAGFPAVVAGAMTTSGTMQHYVVNPGPDMQPWACVPLDLPDQATKCISAVAGDIPGLGRGVYALCVVDDVLDSLTFTTLPAVRGDGAQTVSRRFLLPENYAPTSTAALAALPVRDGKTELYLCGAGLQRYSLSLQKDDNLGLPEQIADKTYFALTPQLSVSCDPAASRIDVWAVNYYDQLVHTTGNLVTTGDAPADEPTYTWQPPMTMAMEVTAVAGYRAPVPQDATADGPRAGYPTQGAVAFAERGSLALMLKGSDSELWQAQAVTFQVPDTAYSINTFTTQITVTDDDNVIVSGADVSIRPSIDVPALVNGKYYALKSTVAKTAATDVYGTVTIVLETTDLSAPTYEIAVANQTAPPPEDPSKDFRAALAAVDNPKSLAYAQRCDGTGALFPDVTEQLVEQCDIALQGAHGLLEVYDILSGPVTTRRHTRPRRPDGSFTLGAHRTAGGGWTARHGHAALAALPPREGWDWLDSVGELLWGAINGAEKAVEWLLDVKDGVVEFVVTLPDRVLAALITIREQALSAINFVLKATLGLTVQDIIAWLGFLFDWSDIRQTHRVLTHVAELGFTYLHDQVDAFHYWMDRLLAAAKDSLVDGVIPIDQSASLFSRRARQAEPSPYPSMNDPQANWATQQVIDNSDGTTVADVSVRDPGDPFADLDQSLVETAQQLSSLTLDALVDGFATMEWGQVLDTYLPLFGAAVIDDTGQVVDAFCAAADDSLGAFMDVLSARWNIPVLTRTYEHDICQDDGSQLSLLDLLTLLVAIPSTVTAKAATGSNVFDETTAGIILGAATWQQMIDGLASLAGSGLVPGADDDTVLKIGAGFVLAAGVSRFVGFIGYGLTRRLSLVDPLSAGLVAGLESLALIFSFANSGCVFSVRKIDSPRTQTDWAMLAIQFPPLVSAWYQVAYLRRYRTPSPKVIDLSFIVMFLGCFMLVGSAVVLVLELKEETPPDADSGQWTALVASKFVENALGAANLILTIEEAMDMEPEEQGKVQALRVIVMALAACAGVFFGASGMDWGPGVLPQSDTGV